MNGENVCQTGHVRLVEFSVCTDYHRVASDVILELTHDPTVRTWSVGSIFLNRAAPKAGFSTYLLKPPLLLHTGMAISL